MFNLPTAATSFRHLIGTACSSPTASMTSEDDVPRTYPRADLTSLLTKMSPPPQAASPEMKCQYKTGTCTNMRTTKKNGKLLMLCELHRRKQNEIKKRSDRKQSAMRMSRRLEAKIKSSSSASSSSQDDYSSDENALRRKFKRSALDVTTSMEAYPVKKLSAWDHSHHHHHHHSHHHHSLHHDGALPHLSALTLPRVSAWRTKDGIATSSTSSGTSSAPTTTQYSNEFTSLLSHTSFFAPDWSPRAPLPSLTPTNNGPVRGHDLAMLEFFLDD
ncbi:hypothetical protein SDRG_01082 [Saprolegnia diclina VS20]|uniref:Uncharacterized protein n=1 Tax=Saprolegnia diclina (strain VS20) TaxID=1156394 RepID=T0SAB2_SAPDV|nr:hypothetical protein SDRG_01082 [Saprolegnia diclina VS20]EQC42248.1 hypothetical protein SDRG_01082 [Saprolegnia diclina VS20]|eukprot:XP_008604817.1 hypothetical protein SDRG_01082 [Saprolegnia diclina VS20]